MQKKAENSTKTETEGKVTKRQKSQTSGRCPYNKQQNIDELRKISLLKILDVEDLVKTAKEVYACPYYASRKAMEDAQIVLVPYNTLLHKSTREASGIDLRNNVVIIDEAHNLLEALVQMYSTEVNLEQLEQSQVRLHAYKERFSKRFTAANMLNLNQLLFVLKKLIKILGEYTVYKSIGYCQVYRHID